MILVKENVHAPSHVNYVSEIVECVRTCAESRSDKSYESIFFQKFKESLDNLGNRKAGDRTFLVTRLEKSIMNVINSTDVREEVDLSAWPSPEIEWKENSPLTGGGLRKRLDILITEPQQQRSVAIEIKARDFNGIAPAMMEIGLAIKYGKNLIVNSKREKKRFPIDPNNTLFVVLLADSGNRDRALFKTMNSLLGNPSNVKFYGFFPENLRSRDCETICNIVSTFFDKIVNFLGTNPKNIEA